MKKQYINNKEFKSLVANICRDIANSNWRPDYVVGITRGGLPAATMISHYFDVPMHALKVSLRHGIDDSESNLWMSEDAFGYEQTKNILIVDDINDSGRTIEWIMEDWRASCMPRDPKWNTVWNNTTRFAVVVDNLNSNAPVKMDYCGKEIDKQSDDWIVFPYENWWE